MMSEAVGDVCMITNTLDEVYMKQRKMLLLNPLCYVYSNIQKYYIYRYTENMLLYIYMYVSTYVDIDLPICVASSLSINQSIYLSGYLTN